MQFSIAESEANREGGESGSFPRTGARDADSQSAREASAKKDSTKLPRFVEMYILIDKAMTASFDGDKAKVGGRSESGLFQ